MNSLSLKQLVAGHGFELSPDPEDGIRGVAHDYNDALSSIIGFNELAMGEMDPAAGLVHRKFRL